MNPKISKLILIIPMLGLSFLCAKECILSSEIDYKVLMGIFFLFFIYESTRIFLIKSK